MFWQNTKLIFPTWPRGPARPLGVLQTRCWVIILTLFVSHLRMFKDMKPQKKKKLKYSWLLFSFMERYWSLTILDYSNLHYQQRVVQRHIPTTVSTIECGLLRQCFSFNSRVTNIFYNIMYLQKITNLCNLFKSINLRWEDELTS